MNLSQLREKIEAQAARLAVIGLGYVGFPVAALFADQGFDVLGIDLKADRVEKINAGISPIEGEEPGLADLMARVIITGRLRASTSYRDLHDQDIILIDVETPVDEQHIPRYEALKSVLRNLGPVLKPGALVIVESTIAPGTMQQLVLPVLEEASGKKLNEGFYLGNCPERVMPGKLLHNLTNLSRVVGGGTVETAQTMALLYGFIVRADLDPVNWITAELVKTVENAYRDVQIAFANEVALICDALGGDVWKVRDLVNKTPYRNMHLPGAGVGGHCIPKDPWLLAYGVRDQQVPLRLIPSARAVNDQMPSYIAGMICGALEEGKRLLSNSRVLILGYAYLENSDDIRNSPSEVLIRILRDRQIEVCVQDPYVSEYQGDPYHLAEGCDAVVLMVKHRDYQSLDYGKLKESLRTPILIDGRGALHEDQLRALGYSVKVIGRGQ